MPISPREQIGQALQSQAAATHEHTLVGPTGGSGWIVGPGASAAKGFRGADPSWASLGPTGWSRANDADVIAWGAWTHWVPWFVMFRGASNPYAPADTATNTCVEVLSMSAQVRRASDQTWVMTHAAGTYDWLDAYNFQTIGGPAGTIQRPAANKFLPDTSSSAHGGRNRAQLPMLNGQPDMDAAYVSLTARLGRINPGGTDDRDQSNLVLVAGADIYPNGTLTVAEILGASTWFPAIGYGRFGWVRREPRKFTLLATRAGVTDASLLAYPPLPV